MVKNRFLANKKVRLTLWNTTREKAGVYVIFPSLLESTLLKTLKKEIFLWKI